MAAPVSWRIKGVNQTTRQMASDAAARRGLSVGEWLERAIKSNTQILPREQDKPLVSAALLNSAREQAPEKDAGRPDAAQDTDQAATAALGVIAQHWQRRACEPAMVHAVCGWGWRCTVREGVCVCVCVATPQPPVSLCRVRARVWSPAIVPVPS